MNLTPSTILQDSIGHVPATIPEAFHVGHDIAKGMDIKRTWLKLDPDAKQSSYAPGEKIIIELPKGQSKGRMYDMLNGALRVKIAYTNNGTTPAYTRIEKGAWNLINRMRIMVGTEQIHDCTDYNMIRTFLWETETNTDVKASKVADIQGYSSTTNRALNNKVWWIALDHPFLNRVIHTGHYKDPIRIELTFEAALKCLESDVVGSSFTYALSEVKFYVPELSGNAQYEAALAANNSYAVNCSWLKYYRAPGSIAAAETLVTDTFKQKYSSVKKIDHIFRTYSTLDNPVTNDKKTTWIVPAITTIQYKLNDHVYPTEAIISGSATEEVEFFGCVWRGEYSSKNGNTGINNPYVRTASNDTSLWYIEFPFEDHPNHGFVGGISLNDTKSNLSYNLVSAAWHSVPTSNEIFITVDTIDKISNGSVRVFE